MSIFAESDDASCVICASRAGKLSWPRNSDAGGSIALLLLLLSFPPAGETASVHSLELPSTTLQAQSVGQAFEL